MSIVCAVDPGNGNTKVNLNGRTAVVQSAVSIPRDIGIAGVGMKHSAKATIVDYEETQVAIGWGAWFHGATSQVFDFHHLGSSERRALFLGALSKVMDADKKTIDLLVLGLPVPLLTDKALAEKLLPQMRAYKGVHQFAINGDQREVDIKHLKVLAQPVGAYTTLILDDQGQTRADAPDGEIAVIDIGLGTLDLYVIIGGRPVPRFIGGAKLGVRRLLESLRERGQDLTELDASLRSGRLQADRVNSDKWLDEVLACIESVWPDPARFATVLLTGGGSLLLGDRLQTELLARGAYVCWPEDPVTANVVGLWRAGVYALKNKAER